MPLLITLICRQLKILILIPIKKLRQLIVQKSLQLKQEKSALTQRSQQLEEEKKRLTQRNTQLERMVGEYSNYGELKRRLEEKDGRIGALEENAAGQKK